MFDAELLKILPDSQTKRLIEYSLSVVSSPACYVFAFTSDLSLDSPTGKEYLRLQELVEESNESGHAINVPISGLCISDREFVYCSAVEPATNTGLFETEVADLNCQKRNTTKTYWASHNVVLKFINHIVNTCCTYAGQRWRIPLDVYFNPSGRSDL